LLSEAAGIAAKLIAHLHRCHAIIDLEIAGSFRRRRETVGDLDVVASADKCEPCMRQLKSFPDVTKVAGSGESKTTVLLKRGLQVDLRVVPPRSFGAALLYSTGGKAHNIRLRRIAQDLGLLLNEYGLFRDQKMIASRTEEELYKALSLPWIARELREDRGEIEAAAAGHLPRLITRGDLRGDLHSHSTYTDGRATIEEIARGARRLGLEYLAITDHSRRVAMAHGLTPARLGAGGRRSTGSRADSEASRCSEESKSTFSTMAPWILPGDALVGLDWVVANGAARTQPPRV
jgi:DNA polymerase (family 10)